MSQLGIGRRAMRVVALALLVSSFTSCLYAVDGPYSREFSAATTGQFDLFVEYDRIGSINNADLYAVTARLEVEVENTHWSGAFFRLRIDPTSSDTRYESGPSSATIGSGGCRQINYSVTFQTLSIGGSNEICRDDVVMRSSNNPDHTEWGVHLQSGNPTATIEVTRIVFTPRCPPGGGTLANVRTTVEYLVGGEERSVQVPRALRCLKDGSPA